MSVGNREKITSAIGPACYDKRSNKNSRRLFDSARVDDVINDPKAEQWVQNIILTGHGLGTKIIAENFEYK
jgi:hypothetical protein